MPKKKKPNIYTCPHCSKTFEKSARNSKNQLCCPHCGGLLKYERGYTDDGTFVGRYVKRTISKSNIVRQKLSKKLLSLPTDIPQVYRVVGDDDADYEVVFQGVVAEELRCPSCGKVTTRNNYIIGSYEFMCKAPLDPKKNNGRKGKCNTRIRYIFKR